MNNLIYVTLIIVLAVCSSCNGQTQKDKKKEAEETVIHKKGNPKTDIKVNRKYDKKGNLISYDSTYSSYYTNKKGDKFLMDSLFREFKPGFIKQYPFVRDENFNALFFNDSLLYNDFFHEDFFKKRYELNDAYMKKVMHEMDSVKNNFFKVQSKSFKK